MIINTQYAEKLHDYRFAAGVHMITILICDDDVAFLNRLGTQVRAIIKKMSKQARIYMFQCAEEIPKHVLDVSDIAFLDIDFARKGYNGIDMARSLRNTQSDAVVIFVTNFAEYAPEGYEVHAFRYLLKQEVERKLEGYLLQALDHIKKARQTMQINVSGEIISVPLEDILYIESQLHTVNVYALKSNKKDTTAYSFYATISGLEEDLCAYGFLRIHKSYLVNMKHIKKYQCKAAELSNGTVLRVSEKNYSEQKKKYLLWKGKMK